MLGFFPDFFRFWLDFSSHSDTLNQHKWWKRCKINANFVKKNLFILFWPIIVCGRGSTSETHKDVRFLNGSTASGKLRYRDSQRPMRGKAHAGKTYAYSYVRTCAHAHMGTCYVRTYMRQTTVPRRVTVSRRLVETSVWEGSRWENIICVLICVHGHIRTCVHAYVRTHLRTHARMYARTHVHMYAHMSARMIFFPSVSLSTHRSTSRDTVASRMSGTAVYRLLLIHRLLLILFVRMSVRLTCAVTHVRTYEYAYWAFPAWTFPRIGLYESPPLYFEKWFKAFITATDSLSMAARKSSLAPLLTPRVTALLQSK